MVISRVIGLSLDNSSGDLALFPLCISVVITAILFGLLGGFVGLLIKERKLRKHKNNGR